MKYIVAVKYKNSTNLKHSHEVFEFDSLKDRDLFINDIKPVSRDIMLSQIEDEE
tara:strand:- start:342 stop:503 length:162 start_codon:yes stop_codon:yes gene_type:complete